jgi:transposase
MFFRISTKKSNGKVFKFVQLARSRREGKVVHTEIIAHLGQLEEFIEKQAPGMINRLKQMSGRITEEAIFENGQDAGNVLAIILLWEKIGLSSIFHQQSSNSKIKFDINKYIQCMVANRLCDPSSKLGIKEWLKGTYFPGLSADEFIYHQALRSMDWLISRKTVLEQQIADKFITLFDKRVQVVFYDITSSYFTSDRSINPEDPEEIRSHGYSRDKRPECYQITIGLVMTEEGLPLCHYVFPGNTVDKSTVCDMVKDIKERFRIKDVVLVGDRGMLSGNNLEMISEEEFLFIISHPLRGDNAVTYVINKVLGKLKKMAMHTDGSVYSEFDYKKRRFVVSYSKEKAVGTKQKREERLRKAEEFIEDKLLRLKRSLDGRMKRSKGRSPTTQGTYDLIHDYLRDHKLQRLFNVNIHKKKIVVKPDNKARKWEGKIDGVLVLETTEKELSPSEISAQYKNLQDVERGFRTLKSSLDLQPNYHWTKNRIKAHVFICVIALQMSRLMRKRLKDIGYSWERAIERLRGIKTFTIKSDAKEKRGITVADKEQKAIYRQLEIPFPQYRDLGVPG